MSSVVAPTRAAHRRRWMALGTLNLAVLLVAIDATVINLAVPEITATLEPSSAQLLWILDVYSLVLAGLLVSAGTLSDRLGRKRVLLAGCALFGVASALAAYAPSSEALIAARVLLAIGGATIMPSTLALIGSIFTVQRERTLAIGLWGAMAAGGAAVGPIVGGALLERFWWGSVFLINVPLMLLLLVVGVAVLPEHRNPAPGRWDAPSAAASMAGLLALIYGIKAAAERGPSWGAALAVALAAGALGWFVRRQARLPEPLIDVGLFRQRAFTGAVLGNLLALLALSGLLLFVSQYLQLVRGDAPLAAGVRMLPLTVGAVLGASLTSSVTRAAGVGVTVPAGLLTGAAGMVAFALALEGSFLLVGAALLLVGVGVGMALTATSDAILAAAPPARAGAASAISETAYELGTGLGIAILGSLLSVLYARALHAPPLPDAATAAARESLASAVAAAEGLPAEQGAALIRAATRAFVGSLRTTAGVSAALLAAAAAVAGALLARKDASL